MISSNYMCKKEATASNIKLLFILPTNQNGTCITFKRTNETYTPYHKKISIISRLLINLHVYEYDKF